MGTHESIEDVCGNCVQGSVPFRYRRQSRCFGVRESHPPTPRTQHGPLFCGISYPANPGPHEPMFSENTVEKPDDGRDRNLEPIPCILASERIYQTLILAFVLARQSHAHVLDGEGRCCHRYVNQACSRVCINGRDGCVSNYGVCVSQRRV